MNIYKVLTILAATLLTTIFVGPTTFAAFSGDPLKDACSQRGAAATNPACKQAAGQGSTDPIVGKNGIITMAVNIISLIAGIGAVVMIIISGIRYTTSGGDPQKAASARAGIFSGLIGVVVVALAWLIVSFVIKLIR